MNSEVIYLNKINEVYFQLELSKSQAMELKETLSFYASNYKYHPQFKAGFWNGKICSFNTKDSLLPIGLLPQLIEFCKQFNYPFVFNFDRVDAFGAPLTEDKFDRFIDAVFPADGPIYPRHYQQDAIYKALSNKRGVLQLATGAGKSVIQYAMIRYLMAMGENILLVVPTVSLVEQMFSDFKEYGWINAQDNCNLIYAGKSFDISKKVTISTWQSIYNKSPAFFKNFTGLMIDECLKGDTKIKTPNGEVLIKDISPGDIIYSYDEISNTIVEDIVVKRHENLTNSVSEDMYDIILENGEHLMITGNHKVLIKGRGWVQAKYITEDDDIMDFYNE